MGCLVGFVGKVGEHLRCLMGLLAGFKWDL